jgi:hypothetical protein
MDTPCERLDLVNIGSLDFEGGPEAVPALALAKSVCGKAAPSLPS